MQKKFSDYAVHVFQIRKNRLLYTAVFKSALMRKNVETLGVRVNVVPEFRVAVTDVLNFFGNLLKMSIRRSAGASGIC